MTTEDRAGDRVAIAEMIHLYAEAVDTLGCDPLQPGAIDLALERATGLFGRCLANNAAIRLYLDGPTSTPIPTPAHEPAEYARFVRAHFTNFGFVGTYHLASNIRVTFTGPHTADVRSMINSTHWVADGRMLQAPILYEDKAIRADDGSWRITERELVVQRWWVTDGYFTTPTDPQLATLGPTTDRAGDRV